MSLITAQMEANWRGRTRLATIVGQTAPLLLGLADEFLPVPLHLVGVHGPKSLFCWSFFANRVRRFRVPSPMAQATPSVGSTRPSAIFKLRLVKPIDRARQMSPVRRLAAILAADVA